MTEMQLEMREEFKRSFLRNQYESYIAAMLDGKNRNTLQKYVHRSCKTQAKMMSDDEILDFLALNWK